MSSLSATTRTDNYSPSKQQQQVVLDSVGSELSNRPAENEGLKFDIDEFQSPLLRQQEVLRSSCILPEESSCENKDPRNQEAGGRELGLSIIPTAAAAAAAASAGDQLLPVSCSREDLVKPIDDRQIYIRDIGDIAVSLHYDPEVVDLVDFAFSNPLLLYLHVMRVKHQLSIIPILGNGNDHDQMYPHDDNNITDAVNHDAEENGGTRTTVKFSSRRVRAMMPSTSSLTSCSSYCAVINYPDESDYPVFRDLSRRLGFYNNSSSPQRDLWADALTDLMLRWLTEVKHHQNQVKALTFERCSDEIERAEVQYYLLRRAEYYKKAESLWVSRFGDHIPDQTEYDTNVFPDCWAILTQHVLYMEGAIREYAVEKLSDVYSQLRERGGCHENHYISERIRWVHTKWSTDHLLTHPILLELHSVMMNNDLLRGWYEVREAMLEGSTDSDTRNDETQILRYHESIMNGSFATKSGMTPDQDADKQGNGLPLPNRSAAVWSPRSSSTIANDAVTSTSAASKQRLISDTRNNNNHNMKLASTSYHNNCNNSHLSAAAMSSTGGGFYDPNIPLMPRCPSATATDQQQQQHLVGLGGTREDLFWDIPVEPNAAMWAEGAGPAKIMRRSPMNQRICTGGGIRDERLNFPSPPPPQPQDKRHYYYC